jgi:hypothetical protein
LLGYDRQIGLNFLPFMEITHILPTTPNFKSLYDGFIGLQPYQSIAILKDQLPSVNFMKALRDNNFITNEVTMIQINKDDSVVKFGGYDQSAIDGLLTIL